MTHFTTDPYFSDGRPRRFAGMHRPPWNYSQILEAAREIGTIFLYSHQVREAWENGQFDYALYHLEEDERE
jgi:hypothetical protein